MILTFFETRRSYTFDFDTSFKLEEIKRYTKQRFSIYRVEFVNLCIPID